MYCSMCVLDLEVSALLYVISLLHNINLSLLYILTMEIVNYMLQVFGFTVSYSSTDGAQTTRNFNRILLGDFKSEKIIQEKSKHILPKNFLLLIYYGFSHVMKKIEYNILRSTLSSNGKKKVNVSGHFIVWCHCYNAHVEYVRYCYIIDNVLY